MIRSIDEAIALWDSGRVLDALGAFDALAAQTSDRNEKAALLANEAKCYASLGQLGDAEAVLRRIWELAPDDAAVCLSVHFVAACVTALSGDHEKAVLQFKKMLEDYGDLLETPEWHDLYEEIQQRRGFALVHLERYGEAVPLLEDARSFVTLSLEAQQEVRLYLGLSYAQLNEPTRAKEEFLGAVAFNLKNEIDARARFNLAVLYFLDGGFAQAKYQLEWLLENYGQAIPGVARKKVYYQLSRVYHYLGERENARRYAEMADESPS